MSKKRIIIFTPEPYLGGELVRKIESWDFEAKAYGVCGDEVYALTACLRPALVLLDLHLIDSLDGIAALAAAQSIHERLSIPVVFLTGSSLDPIAELILLARPYGYVCKACQDRELRMVLTIALNLHETEIRLKQSEERMQVVLRTAMDGFWVVDGTGRFREINDLACRLLGFSREELLQMNIAQIQHGRTPEQIAEGIAAILRTGSGQLEREVICRNGQVKLIELSVTCPAGPERLMYCFGRDITARRQAERELIRMKEEAETSSRAKSAFLAVMSHELRTPLNVVNGISSTLLEQKLEPAQRSALELSLQGGQTLLTMIEDILDFSTLQAGKYQLDAEPFDLPALLHQVVCQVAALPAARHLTLTTSFDSALPYRINGDARLLRQVLLNLLGNAVKFTERGAVHLVVRRQFGGSDRPGLHFSVVDTGVGIDSANRESIFEPFTQVDSSIKRRHGGTGLGLAISRDFVRLMGGELRLRSRPGVGSVFHFDLPFDPVPFTPDFVTGSGKPCLRGQSIVIAVGVGKRRRLLGAFARSWGMNVTLIDPAKTTVAALAAAGPVRLALVDANAVSPNSPLRTWLEVGRQNVPPGVLWILGPDSPVPEVAGIRARSLPAVVDPAALAPLLAEMLQGELATGPLAAPSVAPASLPLSQRIPLAILGADDIKTNRQVVGLILRHLGYAPTLVENGVEVLTALRAQRYDLILLDVQMPVMDGLTAAREICRLYPDAGQRPKIVALTANAMQGDRETCLSAGMDDYLTKPLTPPALVACIEKLFSGGAEVPVSPPSEPGAELSWIDTAHLQLVTQGMPVGQVGEALEEMFTSARADFAQVFPQVQAACAAENTEDLHRAIHGLKGCFQMLGWSQAAQGCIQALAEVRARQFTRWTSFPDVLLALYSRSQTEMTRYIPTRAIPFSHSSCP